jgi:hypothetical protein
MQVILHPPGADWSVAYGTDGTQQVGSAGINGTEVASLWTGTAASWQSLNPTNATSSVAYKVSGGMQVGSAVVNAVRRASLWEGSAASWQDLGDWLPEDFDGQESSARSIFFEGNTVYVVGDAVNGQTGQREAVMWVSGVDTIAPETHITGNIDMFGTSIPDNTDTMTRNLFVTLSGTDDHGVGEFQYSINGGPYGHCTNSIYLSNLKPGSYELRARAIDREGNVDPTPAVIRWRVVTATEGLTKLQTLIELDVLILVRDQLRNTLSQIQSRISDNNPNNDASARKLIDAFIKQVEAGVKSKRIPPKEGSELVTTGTELNLLMALLLPE